MNNLHIQQVGSILSTLGEGPVYDEKSNSILWIDIVNALIIEYDLKNNTERKIETGSMIGSFAITEYEHFIAALQDGIAIIQRNTGMKKMVATPETDIPSNRFNDGKSSPDGHFWAGSMSLNETDPSGSLYSIDEDFKVKKQEGGLTISNGLCWSLDKKYFYFINTPSLQIVRYDYTNGNMSNKKTLITIDAAKDGYPDGMTIDVEGNLWIAHWGGWQVTKWNPLSGEKMTAIQLPVSQVTSIYFGGDDFSDMFITSARRGLISAQLASEPLAGATFRLHNTGFRGIPFYRFKNA
jgi:sugar lactone lactonase YvrE